MRIVSCTQSHNAENIIADALISVLPFVDACMVIDSGITDGTLDVAREVAGDMLIVRPFDWAGDFSRARNFHLKESARRGFDWCVTLDTDERIEGLTREHFETDADVLLVNAQDGSYKKQRCFRLPCKGEWTSPIHEVFLTNGSVQKTVPGASFWEVRKSPEHYHEKFRNIVRVLSAETLRDPTNPHSWYYLGDTHANLWEHEKAIAAFHRCADLRGWSDQSAWSMFRAAECHCYLRQYQAAVDCCAEGLARHPGIGELAWMAAHASYYLGDMQGAICWAKMSVSIGCFHGIGQSIERLGFKKPTALYEGPFDVLQHAYRAIGDEAKSDEAHRQFEQAIEARKSARVLVG